MNGLQLAVIASITGNIGALNDLIEVSGKVDTTSRTDFKFGTGAGLANLVFADRRTIAASGSEELDLDGALTDPFGGALAFKRIKAILVVAAPGNTNKVVVGGAAANGFVGPFGAATHTLALDPGATLLLTAPTAAGWPVTASTADLLKIANGAGGSAVTYEIVLVGADA